MLILRGRQLAHNAINKDSFENAIISSIANCRSQSKPTVTRYGDRRINLINLQEALHSRKQVQLLFDKTVHGAGLFKIGDSVTVTGTRSTLTGQVQISPVKAITLNEVATSLFNLKRLHLTNW
jgi:hypothetical protein